MDQKVNIEALQKELPFSKIRQKRMPKRPVNWQREWDRFDARRIFDFDLFENHTVPFKNHRRAVGGNEKP